MAPATTPRAASVASDPPGSPTPTSPTSPNGTKDKSFGYSKDATELSRRPSFSSTLRNTLVNKEPVAPGAKRGGGLLHKRSTTGRWTKRFFVVHGHYLSYFKDAITVDPTPGSTMPTPAGALDLWHVEFVALEENILSLTLSPEASEARREDMGGKLLRETKRIANANAPSAALPFVKFVSKRLDAATRGASSPKLVLKADTPHEAQLWLTAMRESPFLGSLAKLSQSAQAAVALDLDSPTSSTTHSQTSAHAASVAPAVKGPRLVAKELRITMPPSRQFTYVDADTILQGGTQVRLRNVPEHGCTLSVQINAVDGSSHETTPAVPFICLLKNDKGSVTVPLVTLLNDKRAFATVKWVRVKTPVLKFVQPALAAFVLLTLFSIFALGVPAFYATILGPLAGGGLGARMFLQDKKINNIMIHELSIADEDDMDFEDDDEEDGTAVSSPQHSPRGSPRHAQGASSPSAAGAQTGAKPNDVVVSARSKIKRKKGAAPLKLGTSSDLNVSPEEAGLLEDLRERVKDLYHIPAKEADAFVKKHHKLLEEWGADMNALKDPVKVKKTLDKHVGADFRCVRYLRARKHDLVKAETMLREAMMWKIALGMDYMLENDWRPQPWIVEYNGSPIVAKLLDIEKDLPERLSRFWLRDRQGHLCMFLRSGQMNSRKMFRKVDYNTTYLVKNVIWAAELLRNDLDQMHIQTQGRVESLVTAVVDLDGFAISEQIPVGDLVPLARRWFPVLSTQLPEALERVLVVQAPWLFASLWHALSPFIPPEVAEKIQINNTLAYDRISKYIDPQYIPAYLGGSLYGASKDNGESGDPYCSDRLPPYGPYTPDKGAYLLEGTEPEAKRKP